LRSAETHAPILTFPQNTIIVARELAPSTLIEIAKSNIAGIVTERGGWTSHTFILARELGIAAVTGIRNPTRLLKENLTALVDGFAGRVVSRPSAFTLKRYAKPASSRAQKAPISAGARTSELKTLDGRRIELFVNLDRVENYERAQRQKARGVGLFRSELLLENRRRFPSAEEQVRRYSELLKSASGAPVNIRTFDLDAASDLNAEFDTDEKNPALGLRAIRLSLDNEKLFRMQLSALLRGSKFGDLGILLPMISDLEQILKVKQLLKSEMRKLKRKRVAFGKPRIGAMIEVPASALMCDALCNEVDFLSLGTNDLIQYLLAVDRDNESVASYFRTLHPAVLLTVKNVLVTAAKQKRPVMICGEMAGSPFYAPILVGLGATQLSMNSSSLPRIREAIANIAFDEAREIASQLVAASTADEGEKLLQDFFKAKWRHIVGFELST
jgi:phosphotransferase system enzyme I (PtsI)